MGYHFDEDAAASAIDDMIKDDLSDEMYTLVKDLPEDLNSIRNYAKEIVCEMLIYKRGFPETFG